MGKLELRLILNGRPVTFSAPAGESLMRALLNHGQTDIKCGCETGDCGSCAVLLDGLAVKSCIVLAAACDGHAVDTVRGRGAADPLMQALQQSFVSHGAVSCGFCTPGMLTAAYGYLKQNGKPSRRAIRNALSGNLCRCTGYTGIVEAVYQTARALESGAVGDQSEAWEKARGEFVYAGDIRMENMAVCGAPDAAFGEAEEKTLVFSDAAVHAEGCGEVIKNRFTLAPRAHAALELTCCTGYIDASGAVVLRESEEAPPTLMAHTTALVRKTGHPVQCTFNRAQAFKAPPAFSGAEILCETRAAENGLLLEQKISVTARTGDDAVFEAAALFAREVQLNVLAARLKLSPFTLRRLNETGGAALLNAVENALDERRFWGVACNGSACVGVAAEADAQTGRYRACDAVVAFYGAADGSASAGGACVKGLSAVMLEDLAVENGVPAVDGFSTYLIPTAFDVPAVRVIPLAGTGQDRLNEAELVSLASAAFISALNACVEKESAFHALPVKPEAVLKVLKREE